MTGAGYCGCAAAAQEPQLIEGIRICARCGCQVADPRDRLLVLIAQQQRQMLDRLDRLEKITTDEGITTIATEKETSTTTDDPELITPAELAQRLGRRRDWVYDNADRLGAVRLGDGPRPRLYFRIKEASERLAARANGNGSKPKPGKPPRRSAKRRASTDVALLPIKEP